MNERRIDRKIENIAISKRNMRVLYTYRDLKPTGVLSNSFADGILSRIGRPVGLYSLYSLEYLLDGEQKGGSVTNIHLKLFLNRAGLAAETREKSFINKNIEKISATVSEHLNLKYAVRNYNSYSKNIFSKNMYGGNNLFSLNMYNNTSGTQGGSYGSMNVFDMARGESNVSNKMLKSVLSYLSVFNSRISGANQSNENFSVSNYANRVPGVFELINQTYTGQNHSVSRITGNIANKVTKHFENLFSAFNSDVFNTVKYITNIQNKNDVSGDVYKNHNYNIYGNAGSFDYTIIRDRARHDGNTSDLITNRLRRHFAALFGRFRLDSESAVNNDGNTELRYYNDVAAVGFVYSGGLRSINSDDVYYENSGNLRESRESLFEDMTTSSRNIAKRLTRHIETLLTGYGVGINSRGNFTVLNVSGFNRAQNGSLSTVGARNETTANINYDENPLNPIRKIESDIKSVTERIMADIVPKYKVILDFIEGRTSQKTLKSISGVTGVSKEISSIKTAGLPDKKAEKHSDLSETLKIHSDINSNNPVKNDFTLNDLSYMSSENKAEQTGAADNFGKDMPPWASRFLSDSFKNKKDSGGVVPEFNTVTGAETVNNIQNTNTVWNAPQYNNNYRPNEIVLKKSEETVNNYRQSISNTEINHVANKVYEMLEKRVGVEKRRLGF